MLPRSPVNHSTHGLLSNAESSRKRTVRIPFVCHAPDIHDDLRRQFSVGVSFPACCPALTGGIPEIIRRCAKKQMVGIETPGVVTSVQDKQRGVDRVAQIYFGGDAMNVGAAVVDTDTTVRQPALYNSTSPYPASGVGVNATVPQQSGTRRLGYELSGSDIGDNLGVHLTLLSLGAMPRDASTSPGLPLASIIPQFPYVDAKNETFLPADAVLPARKLA
jgi:hypothetical protein